jgi:hypothetical protein
MSEETRLDVLDLEWFFQQRVLAQVEHTQAQVHTGLEVAVHLVNLFLAERLAADGCSGSAIRREALRVSHCGGVENEGGVGRSDEKERRSKLTASFLCFEAPNNSTCFAELGGLNAEHVWKLSTSRYFIYVTVRHPTREGGIAVLK